MRTDDLILTLTRDVPPVPRRAVERRLGLGIAAGAVFTFAAMLAWLGFRPDLAAALHGFTFWMKWSYTILLAGIAITATIGLSRPDARRDPWLGWVAVPILLLAAVSLGELIRTPSQEWLAMWLGASARQCPWRIALLSIPIFAGLLWAFRRLAPSRLRAAGAAAGLAAGASAATIYALACPEVSATFVLTWYTLGMAIATAVGALLGPRLLRW